MAWGGGWERHFAGEGGEGRGGPGHFGSDFGGIEEAGAGQHDFGGLGHHARLFVHDDHLHAPGRGEGLAVQHREQVEGGLPFGAGELDRRDGGLEGLEQAAGVLERAGLLGPRAPGEDDVRAVDQRAAERVDEDDEAAVAAVGGVGERLRRPVARGVVAGE